MVGANEPGLNMGVRKNPGETRTNVLRIRLTKAERAALDGAAEAQDQDTSTWARQRLLALVRRTKKTRQA